MTKRKSKTVACLITLIPVIAMMIFIYCMSAQDGRDSGAASGRITNVVVRILHSDYDELPKAEQEEIFGEVSFYVRKTAHFSEYAALAFFAALHIFNISVKRRIAIPAAIVFSAGYAFLDEWHQSFVAGRAQSLFDVGVDSCGAVLGALVMLLIISILLKKSKVFAFLY